MLKLNRIQKKLLNGAKPVYIMSREAFRIFSEDDFKRFVEQEFSEEYISELDPEGKFNLSSVNPVREPQEQHLDPQIKHHFGYLYASIDGLRKFGTGASMSITAINSGALFEYIESTHNVLILPVPETRIVKTIEDKITDLNYICPENSERVISDMKNRVIHGIVRPMQECLEERSAKLYRTLFGGYTL